MTRHPGSCEARHAHRWLLASITALGLLSAVAFSASYQMVARFANKNVIALGLGCAGCGLMVLGLELVLGALPMREHVRTIWLLELTAGARRAACSMLCCQATLQWCLFLSSRAGLGRL